MILNNNNFITLKDYNPIILINNFTEQKVKYNKE